MFILSWIFSLSEGGNLRRLQFVGAFGRSGYRIHFRSGFHPPEILHGKSQRFVNVLLTSNKF